MFPCLLFSSLGWCTAVGYQSKACPESFGTSIRAMKEEISKKVDAYVNMLQQSAEDCEDQGVKIEVKITAGFPIKNVIIQEVQTYNAAWVFLDRHFRRDLKLYVKQIPCKVALVDDSLNVEVLRNHTLSQTDVHLTEIRISDTHSRGENKQPTMTFFQRKRRSCCHTKDSGAPLLCAACGLRTEMYIQDSKKFTYSVIQQATNDFSMENLLGEGGYGRVYKGKLKDGQLIAAKVRKQESTQGFTEFNSEVSVLSFARHKNIVMLLGYFCKDKLNILVYEYICNKSLHWHLFDNTENVLDWHQRRAIAIGTAKGLRFLHEECRGGPIIHRDMRPSNILLTHDLVPMLGDFGLARRKIDEDTLQTTVLGTLGYLAPEYAENGFVSVRTDVYAFGIVLLQLMSGRKVIDLESKGQNVSLRQW
ncbi:hypothetical protein Golob_011046, partial [Gossypium lobatum]|nr:hypothetical protein [Gossypium lobatum]